MADHPSKAKFIEAVHAHMAVHGAKDWRLVLDQFPDVHDQTKWRWLRQARNETPRPTDLNRARDRLAASVKKFPTTRNGSKMREKLAPEAEPIVDHLPAAPSPAYIAKHGDEGLRTIDFVAEIQRLYGDAQMLRTYALKRDKDGNPVEAINNPAAFDKSIVRRAHLLETAIKAVQEVWDLRTMQNFYETIIDEIGKESPECQQRIMQRLAALNARTGMTLDMMKV